MELARGNQPGSLDAMRDRGAGNSRKQRNYTYKPWRSGPPGGGDERCGQTKSVEERMKA